MKTLIPILNRSIQAHIESFRVRDEQMTIFKQSNAVSIKALQAKLKGDNTTYDELWQKGIDLKDQAKAMGIEADNLRDRASNLEGIYHLLVEEFTQ